MNADAAGEALEAYACPACGFARPLAARLRGRKIRCPRCGATNRWALPAPMDTLLIPDPGLAAAPADAAPAPSAPAAEDPIPGGEAPRYRLDQRIGGGGEGEVWRGWDEQLRRAVAVKILRSAEDEEVMAGIVREGRTLAELDHPHIARIYDVGVRAGRPFLVVQWIDGVHLTQAGLAPAQAAAVLHQIADGLACAHDRGVVHRDVKPANLMVARSADAQPHAWIIDFGVATAEGRAGSADGRAAVAGTPAYMSPEQAAGEAIDDRADVYGLGASIYELLAGRPPYQGDAGQVLLRLLDGPPPPLPRGAPRRLARIVERAMARKREHRYQSMAAMAEDLAVCAGLRRRPRRSWLGIAAAAAAAAAAAGVWVAVEARREGRLVDAIGGAAASLAVADWPAAEAALAAAEGIAPGDARVAAVRAQLTRIRAEQGFADAIGRCGDRLAAVDFAGAEAALAEAAAIDPGHALVAGMRERIAATRRTWTFQAEMADAGRQLAAQTYAEAAAAAGRAAAAAPTAELAAAAEALRGRILAARERRQLAELSTGLRVAIVARDWERAEAAVGALAAARHVALVQAIMEAIAARDWRTARARLDEAQAERPEDAALLTLRRRVDAEDRGADLAALLARARAALAERRADAAIAAADAAVAAHPRSAEALALQREARALHAVQARTASLAAIRAAMDRHAWDEASRMALALLAADRGDREAAALLDQINAARRTVIGLLRERPPRGEHVAGIAAAGGALAAVTLASGEIRLWDAEGRQAERTLASLERPAALIRGPARAGAAATLSALVGTEVLCALDPGRTGPGRSLRLAHPLRLAAERCLASGELAGLRADGSLLFVDPATGSTRFSAGEHADAAMIAVSPAGDALATASPQRVRIWHPQSGAMLLDAAPGALVRALAAAEPGAAWIGCHDGSLRRLAADAPPRAIANAHAGAITAIAIAGGVLISAGFDRKLRCWGLPRGDGEPASWATYAMPAAATAIAALPEAGLVLTAGEDDAVRVWRVPVGAGP